MLYRSLVAALAAVVLLVGGFWFLFGTVSPCDALRAEYRRQGEKKVGVLGKAVMAIAGELKTDDMTPVECTQRVMRLRFGDDAAFEDLTK